MALGRVSSRLSSIYIISLPTYAEYSELIAQIPTPLEGDIACVQDPFGNGTRGLWIYLGGQWRQNPLDPPVVISNVLGLQGDGTDANPLGILLDTVAPANQATLSVNGLLADCVVQANGGCTVSGNGTAGSPYLVSVP
jgi:hypothetical protein